MFPIPGRRRAYDAQFKAAVIAACQEPGTSVASVALAHGMNANLLHKWLAGRGLKRSGLGAVRPRPATELVTSAAVSAPSKLPTPVPALEFVALSVPAPGKGLPPRAPCEAADIRVQLERGGVKLSVRWPASQAQACSAWLNGVLGAPKE